MSRRRYTSRAMQSTQMTAAGGELPFDGAAQRRVELAWSARLSGKSLADQVRPLVLDSWSRSLRAGVSADLKRAPLVWNDEQLHEACEHFDWFAAAQQTLARQHDDPLEGGHVLTLFDGSGRMLLSEGDPRALEGLAEMNFRPGAQWSEDCAGTNGPGTALALGRPVHVVGAEHFCERWHPWHCAAAPVRDPSTGEVVAVVGISGFREMGHPHTLRLTSAIAGAIEQRLAAVEAERRVLLLQQFAQLAGRWPGETLLAIDRAGCVLASTHELPAGLAGDSGRERLRTLLARAAAHAQDRGPEEVTMPVATDLIAVCRPIFDGRAHAGSCLVLQHRPAHVRPPRAPPHGSTRYSLDDVVGSSQKLSEARTIALVATRNALPVLLTGESGTGKEVFAQGIHAASDRSAKRFVGVNCASLSHELVESEFFGYVGGAFSGARREGNIGKFEAASGGTLFLDEIAELSSDAQAALLRALQEGEVVPVGGTQPRPIDVRVIAATNRDIHACLQAGTLREDLFHRLNVLAIQLPPLRTQQGSAAARRSLLEGSRARAGPRAPPTFPCAARGPAAVEMAGKRARAQERDAPPGRARAGTCADARGRTRRAAARAFSGTRAAAHRRASCGAARRRSLAAAGGYRRRRADHDRSRGAPRSHPQHALPAARAPRPAPRANPPPPVGSTPASPASLGLGAPPPRSETIAGTVYDRSTAQLRLAGVRLDETRRMKLSVKSRSRRRRLDAHLGYAAGCPTPTIEPRTLATDSFRLGDRLALRLPGPQRQIC